MRTLRVSLADRSYNIDIGASLLDDATLIEPLLSGRVAVVTNSVVAPLYLKRLTAALRNKGLDCDELILPDGERYKTWETLNSIFDWMMAQRCDRTTTLIALGGGVIGDLVGFAAATYQRGIPFIQIPTTLLAQVDSSVGGKTGINHPRGKNMVGAFWQPKLVVADTETLNTLPDRELSAGMAEVIKYGLIRDLPFFEWLETNIDRLMNREPDALAYAIERSCANKAEVVGSDERETAHDGGRALLNLGHTFGHAIETGIGYGEWLHGEAVAAGTVMALELSLRMGWVAAIDIERVKALLLRARLPVKGPALGVDRYLELMGHDKKVLAGKLRLVLLEKVGKARTVSDADPAMIRDSIACCSA